MRPSKWRKRTGPIAAFSSLALCVGVSCSSNDATLVRTPGAAGAPDGGASGAPLAVDPAGDAGKVNAPAGGDAGEGGASGERSAAGQPATAGMSGNAGAGGSGGIGGAAMESPGFTTIAEADFEATFAKVFCDSVAHCCSAGVATCVDTEVNDFAAIHQQANAANNVYDPARAAQCANAIVALGDHAACSLSFMSQQRSLLPCRGVFDGTGAPGDQCTSVASCQQGIADQPDVGGYAGCLTLNGTSPNRCRQFVVTTTAGATCQGAPNAGSDGVVHICAHDMTCKSGQCVALPKLGAAHARSLKHRQPQDAGRFAVVIAMV